MLLEGREAAASRLWAPLAECGSLLTPQNSTFLWGFSHDHWATGGAGGGGPRAGAQIIKPFLTSQSLSLSSMTESGEKTNSKVPSSLYSLQLRHFYIKCWSNERTWVRWFNPRRAQLKIPTTIVTACFWLTAVIYRLGGWVSKITNVKIYINFGTKQSHKITAQGSRSEVIRFTSK